MGLTGLMRVGTGTGVGLFWVNEGRDRDRCGADWVNEGQDRDRCGAVLG